MKKLLIFTFLVVACGIINSCDKDENENNPFAGTVWKCRTQVAFILPTGGYGTVNGYKVFHFYQSMSYSTCDTDELGTVLDWTGGGRYSLDHRSRMMTCYDWNGEVLTTIGYRNGLASEFVCKDDTGLEYHYIRQ